MAKVATKNRVAAQLATKPDTGNGKAPAQTVQITRPNQEVLRLKLTGTAPLVLHRFSQKMQEKMAADQKAGSTTRSKRKRDPKDFEALYLGAQYTSHDVLVDGAFTQGKEKWQGINAASFRNAAIDACRLVGFKMTHAKLGVFIEADGYDSIDGTPLVRITEGEPQMWVAPARNATGVVDLRVRPRWPTWGLVLTVRYDADMFTRDDIVNLFMRVGCQVGIGEGRPNSKSSAGLGFGLFTLEAH